MTNALWFPYGHFQFRRKEVQWVLENASTFEQGRWPRRPSTGYIDQQGAGQPRPASEAGFVKPMIIWAEITARLEQCGIDGLDCRDYHLGLVTINVLCRHRKCDEDIVNRFLQGVVSYVASGPCRRWVACPEHCEDQLKCPRPYRTPVFYNEWRQHRRQGRLPLV